MRSTTRGPLEYTSAFLALPNSKRGHLRSSCAPSTSASLGEGASTSPSRSCVVAFTSSEAAGCVACLSEGVVALLFSVDAGL